VLLTYPPGRTGTHAYWNTRDLAERRGGRLAPRSKTDTAPDGSTLVISFQRARRAVKHIDHLGSGFVTTWDQRPTSASTGGQKDTHRAGRATFAASCPLGRRKRLSMSRTCHATHGWSSPTSSAWPRASLRAHVAASSSHGPISTRSGCWAPSTFTINTISRRSARARPAVHMVHSWSVHGSNRTPRCPSSTR